MLPLPVTDESGSLRFRPFKPTDEDFEAVVKIYNACWPSDPKSPEQFQATHELELQSEFMYRRVMAELNDEIVAYAVYREVNYAHIPGKYEIQVNVLPEYRSMGIGRKLFKYVSALLEQREPKPSIIMVETRTHHKHAIKMIESMEGYEMVMRHKVAVLDVAKFDFERFAKYDERMRSQNIAIKSVEALAEDNPNWQKTLYDIYWGVYDDIPATSDVTRATFDDFVLWLEHPSFSPAGSFVAIDQNAKAWVGLTVTLIKLADPEKVQTDITGVRRSHRRMGIATALKLAMIRWAHKNGVKQIQTDNEEHNPMFRLNIHMGFTDKPDWLTFEKVIPPSLGTALDEM